MHACVRVRACPHTHTQLHTDTHIHTHILHTHHRMALPTSFLAAVLLVALLGSARGAVAVTCSTNGNSPTQADANNCVQYLRGLGSTRCCQNVRPSGCTTMCTSGTAAVDICGTGGDCVNTCVSLGNILNDVLASCVVVINGVARVAGSTPVQGTTPTVQIRRS